jgi:hypothetical protein
VIVCTPPLMASRREGPAVISFDAPLSPTLTPVFERLCPVSVVIDPRLTVETRSSWSLHCGEIAEREIVEEKLFYDTCGVRQIGVL